jgi:hypothetical protein|tara:strand:- start:2669 stop:2893 length:225 start_codon:yes stop_codon:yes gene_type:complete
MKTADWLLEQMDEKDTEIVRLKTEVNHYHRKYFDTKLIQDDWEAHEYDINYDDKLAMENMKNRRDSYKPIYENE